LFCINLERGKGGIDSATRVAVSSESSAFRDIVVLAGNSASGDPLGAAAATFQFLTLASAARNTTRTKGVVDKAFWHQESMEVENENRSFSDQEHSIVQVRVSGTRTVDAPL
jgi:hypothetical protein